MPPLGIFRRRKKEEEKAGEAEKKPAKTLLEELCGSDSQLQRVLSRTLLLNPSLTMREEMGAYATKAEEYEKQKDYVRARIAYQVAGEIALYENKPSHVQKIFKKAAQVDPEYENRDVFEFFLEKENAEKALAIAQEYYTRTRKFVESEESSSE